MVLGRVHGQTHVGNETRGVVLDLTADRFGADPVILRALPGESRRWLTDKA